MNKSIKQTTGRSLVPDQAHKQANLSLVSNKSLLEQPGTVKDKFQCLQQMAEDLVKNVEDEMVQLNDFSTSLIGAIQGEREKPKVYVKEVTTKIHKFQEQINKHFEHQHSENEKMQKEITDLKGDKTAIEQDLIGRLSLTQPTPSGSTTSSTRSESSTTATRMPASVIKCVESSYNNFISVIDAVTVPQGVQLVCLG